MENYPLPIQDAAVHLWCIVLTDRGDMDAELLNILSSEERERAAKFRFESDRVRYLRSHGMMRKILARYLGVEPQVIRIMKTRTGKPVLNMGRKYSHLNFNLSHSAEMMLLGISNQRRLGVDVEFVASRVDVLSIAKWCFRPEEHARVEVCPAERQLQEFFFHWTCKEAYLKAVGTGLAGDLRNFPCDETGRMTVIGCRGVQSQSFGPWTMFSLQPAEDYQAAVVAEGRELELVLLGDCQAGISEAPVVTGSAMKSDKLMQDRSRMSVQQSIVGREACDASRVI